MGIPVVGETLVSILILCCWSQCLVCTTTLRENAVHARSRPHAPGARQPSERRRQRCDPAASPIAAFERPSAEARTVRARSTTLRSRPRSDHLLQAGPLAAASRRQATRKTRKLQHAALASAIHFRFIPLLPPPQRTSESTEKLNAAQRPLLANAKLCCEGT